MKTSQLAKKENLSAALCEKSHDNSVERSQYVTKNTNCKLNDRWRRRWRWSWWWDCCPCICLELQCLHPPLCTALRWLITTPLDAARPLALHLALVPFLRDGQLTLLGLLLDIAPGSSGIQFKVQVFQPSRGIPQCVRVEAAHCTVRMVSNEWVSCPLALLLNSKRTHTPRSNRHTLRFHFIPRKRLSWISSYNFSLISVRKCHCQSDIMVVT